MEGVDLEWGFDRDVIAIVREVCVGGRCLDGSFFFVEVSEGGPLKVPACTFRITFSVY